MTDELVKLDLHRGMAAQQATDLRRLSAEVQGNERDLRARRDELESNLIATPAANWHEAARKATYLLKSHIEASAGGDIRTKQLIDAVLQDFERLCAETPRDDGK
jgi:hypothetical protein